MLPVKKRMLCTVLALVTAIGILPVGVLATGTLSDNATADGECQHSWLGATCSKPKTCELCGATEGQANGHSPYGTTTQAPTCTQSGMWVATCENCGEVTHSWTISENGHRYRKEVTAQPTCTGMGVVTYTCTDCGYSYSDSVMHNLNEVLLYALQEFDESNQDFWVIEQRLRMTLFPTYHEGCDWNCQKVMSAAEFEAELNRYVAVNEDILATFRLYFDYAPEAETYCIQHAGGYGGIVYTRAYMGYVDNGKNYTVYFEERELEWLPKDGYDQLYQMGTWPESFEYEGKLYENFGCGEYAHVVCYTGEGTKYTVEYDGNTVRILSWSDYSAGERPESFDDGVYPELNALGHTWVDSADMQICANCGMSSDCQEGRHEYTAKVTNPTLTCNGYTTFTCRYCGDSYRENYTFPDVPSSLWSYKSVEFAVAKGYFTGYKSGNFGPTDQITRQDFVVVLARLAKVDLSRYSGRTDFPDVKAGDYYEKAVKWASSNGIVSGYKNGNFGVGDKITREQMVTILYNYAKKMGYDTSVPTDAAAKLNTYADAHKITGYARPAVIWALSKGVISGMNATTIGGQEYASRGQTATILMNISTKGIMPI